MHDDFTDLDDAEGHQQQDPDDVEFDDGAQPPVDTVGREGGDGDQQQQDGHEM